MHISTVAIGNAKISYSNYKYSENEKEIHFNIYGDKVFVEGNRDLSKLVRLYEPYLTFIEVSSRGSIRFIKAEVPINVFKYGVKNLTSKRIENLKNVK